MGKIWKAPCNIHLKNREAHPSIRRLVFIYFFGCLSMYVRIVAAGEGENLLFSFFFSTPKKKKNGRVCVCVCRERERRTWQCADLCV